MNGSTTFAPAKCTTQFSLNKNIFTSQLDTAFDKAMSVKNRQLATTPRNKHNSQPTRNYEKKATIAPENNSGTEKLEFAISWKEISRLYSHNALVQIINCTFFLVLFTSNRCVPEKPLYE